MRTRTAELMDDPRLDVKTHFDALAGLERINIASRVANAIWPRVARLANASPYPLRVLDIATGAGDLPRALTKLARRSGIALEAAGCDISANALIYAGMQAAREGIYINFFKLDPLREPVPRGYDVITCALFLHHLSDEDAVTLLRRMKSAAGSVVLIDDLRRDRIGLALAWAGTRLLSASNIVRLDGEASVRAAFTVIEARHLAEEAGLENAAFSTHWPRRWLLEWRRS